MAERAKVYSYFKYGLSILDTFFLLAFLYILTASGLSKDLEFCLSSLAPGNIFILPLYFLILSVVYYLLSFPVTICRSYIIERKFNLSSQSLKDWFFDQLKGGIIYYIVGLILLCAFYYILKLAPNRWWLVISAFWILFNLVLTKLAPVVIIPLFFKYKELSDESLRARIINLTDKMQIKILNVFEINLSKKTLKANAALLGWGSSMRVILADTLKDKYTYDEIEVILAHEFAHYKLRHLPRQIIVNSLFIVTSFYLIFKTSGYVLGKIGLLGLSDMAALPLVFIYFVLFGITVQPFTAYYSRRLEKSADRMALEVTGLRGPFISMMEKLASQNLADRSPHPIIKFLFFDHPPIDERINMAGS